jgi:hypothetical protein
MHKLTSFLYARPSWIEGIARLADFAHTLDNYNLSEDSQQADSLALLSDWYVVGDDLSAAMQQYKALTSQASDELWREAKEAISGG